MAKSIGNARKACAGKTGRNLSSCMSRQMKKTKTSTKKATRTRKTAKKRRSK